MAKPSPMHTAKQDRIAVVLRTVAESKAPISSEEVAKRLNIPLRTARRYLSDLYLAGKAMRIGVYEGEPLSFAYRYMPAPADAKPKKKAKKK